MLEQKQSRYMVKKRGSRWKSFLPDCHQPCVPDSKLFMRLGFHDNTEGFYSKIV